MCQVHAADALHAVDELVEDRLLREALGEILDGEHVDNYA